MRRWMGLPVAAMLLMAACVTINVYFPAAEAREAAKEFVEKVIDEKIIDEGMQPGETSPAEQPDKQGGPSAALAPRPARVAVADRAAVRINWFALVGIGAAHAQPRPDITIQTPAIQAIQARMAARFDAVLRAGFASGALGFTSNGTIVVRDASKLDLRERVAVKQAVAEDNRDRNAVYREIAVANGHPEWESRIRAVFAEQWIASARPGWWYQDSNGNWKQK